jgi:hypothetical protein
MFALNWCLILTCMLLVLSRKVLYLIGVYVMSQRDRIHQNVSDDCLTEEGHLQLCSAVLCCGVVML